MYFPWQNFRTAWTFRNGSLDTVSVSFDAMLQAPSPTLKNDPQNVSPNLLNCAYDSAFERAVKGSEHQIRGSETDSSKRPVLGSLLCPIGVNTAKNGAAR
jgi:hypothetical protein